MYIKIKIVKLKITKMKDIINVRYQNRKIEKLLNQKI